jgi:hypothetical protein
MQTVAVYSHTATITACSLSCSSIAIETAAHALVNYKLINDTNRSESKHMTTAFETLYDLAVTIQVDPSYRKLTAHHTDSIATAERSLQRSILQLVMPGEDINSPWQITRIFCRNLVNRAQAPMSDTDMLGLLNHVELMYTTDEERVKFLSTVAADKLVSTRSRQVIVALEKFTSSKSISALGNQCYLDWVSQRWVYWNSKHIHQLDLGELLKDLHILCKHKETKIEGIGFALAANFFADLGLTCFGKPDLHVTPIINLLQLRWGEQEAFEGLLQISQKEADKLRRNKRFTWLEASGGLMPRLLDRIIYLIGSDNLILNGLKNKRHAPARRDLIRQAFIDRGLIQSNYQ